MKIPREYLLSGEEENTIYVVFAKGLFKTAPF